MSAHWFPWFPRFPSLVPVFHLQREPTHHASGVAMRRVVLGLDQAASTGWGIAAERGPVVRHGLACSHADRLAVVRLALEYAAGDPRWLWVVLEQHDHMPLGRLGRHDHTTQRAGRAGGVERGTAQIYGMGKNTGRWLELVEMVGVPSSHVSDVRPTTWRSRVHGVTRGDSDAIKQAAVDYASRASGERIESHDHAEGYCITVWAAIDGLARYDAEKAQARMGARVKREQAKQAELFGGKADT